MNSNIFWPVTLHKEADWKTNERGDSARYRIFRLPTKQYITVIETIDSDFQRFDFAIAPVGSSFEAEFMSDYEVDEWLRYCD